MADRGERSFEGNKEMFTENSVSHRTLNRENLYEKDYRVGERG